MNERLKRLSLSLLDECSLFAFVFHLLNAEFRKSFLLSRK
jgi:hypothetical protein